MTPPIATRLSPLRLDAIGPPGDVVLGQAIAIRLGRRDPDVETRAYLTHQQVLYPRSLSDWNRDDVLEVFPESPGRYRLRVQWRTADGDSGHDELAFRVGEAADSGGEPHLATISRDLKLWAPSRWEASVTTPAEQASLDFLQRAIAPDWVVYDVGANIGSYTLRLARWARRVVAIEANPLCVAYLRTNLERDGATHVDILPVALLDREGETGFVINYGNTNLGITADSGHYRSKIGHEIRVPCWRLDEARRVFGLPAPQAIKLDVEGAEGAAIRGMAETLREALPLLALEIHGAGAMFETLAVLDAIGYRYRRPQTADEWRSAAAVHEHFGDRVFQLVALPPRRDR